VVNCFQKQKNLCETYVCYCVYVVNLFSCITRLTNVFSYVVPGIAVAGILASKMVFKKKLGQIPADATLATKMTDYRAALIVSYALMEGPALLAIMSAFLTGSVTLLIFAGIIVLLMLQARPRPQKAVSDLALEDTEIIVLEDPDGIIE
jgi:hypothetical protein